MPCRDELARHSRRHEPQIDDMSLLPRAHARQGFLRSTTERLLELRHVDLDEAHGHLPVPAQLTHHPRSFDGDATVSTLSIPNRPLRHLEKVYKDPSGWAHVHWGM
jgi:hypothetical protein